MRLSLALWTASALAVCGLSGGGPARAAVHHETVEVPGHGGVTLKAALFRPDGAGPFPAVVALHNCTGLHNSRGKLGTRYVDWAQRLVKDGFAVLLPDSNGSRGLGNQCGVRGRSIRVDRERVEDAEAALSWLQHQAWVSAGHVSLLGWSSGATAALWVTRVRPMPPANDGDDFHSVVALYPDCRRLGVAAWSARVPTLILIGRADEVVSAATCQQMVAGARGRSARVAIHVYPGAHHDFDHPNRPLQVRSGLAVSVDGSGRAHSGTNAAARADALKRVPAWFKQ